MTLQQLVPVSRLGQRIRKAFVAGAFSHAPTLHGGSSVTQPGTVGGMPSTDRNYSSMHATISRVSETRDSCEDGVRKAAVSSDIRTKHWLRRLPEAKELF